MLAKYGDVSSLSPSEAVWEDDTVRVSVEKPLQVKYLDKKVFATITANSQKEQSLETLRREDFLKQF